MMISIVPSEISFGLCGKFHLLEGGTVFVMYLRLQIFVFTFTCIHNYCTSNIPSIEPALILIACQAGITYSFPNTSVGRTMKESVLVIYRNNAYDTLRQQGSITFRDSARII